MSETHFRWPGRYAMWREAGGLRLEVEAGPEGARRPFRADLRPAEGYAFLMNRRRTELLYAIAEAMAAAGALDDAAFRELVNACATGTEDEIAALATRWNAEGRVVDSLAALLGAPVPGCAAPRWFARRRRA
ncbi:MAG: hypothetical protein AAF371_12185 [Pseudomonadota bacterium]